MEVWGFSEHAPSTGYEPKSCDKDMLSYDQSTDYVFGNGGFLTVPGHISRKASIVSASSASSVTELIKKEHPHHSSVLLSTAKPVAAKEKRVPSGTGDVLVTPTRSARRNPLQIECVFGVVQGDTCQHAHPREATLQKSEDAERDVAEPEIVTT